jgi:hypothetical protein
MTPEKDSATRAFWVQLRRAIAIQHFKRDFFNVQTLPRLVAGEKPNGRTDQTAPQITTSNFRAHKAPNKRLEPTTEKRGGSAAIRQPDTQRR